MHVAEVCTAPGVSAGSVAASAELMELCRRIRNERPLESSAARKVPTVPGRKSPVSRIDFRRLLRSQICVPTLARLCSWIVALVPMKFRGSSAVHLACRHPGIAGWSMTFACLGVFIAGQGTVVPLSPDRNPVRYQKWLQQKGTEAVQASLAEIGAGITVPSVQARPIDDWIVGTYQRGDRVVTFNSTKEFSDTFLLEVAAHESVHAIFDQRRLQPHSTTHGEFFGLVNETAAYVLGAHIAGDAWGRLGHRGRALSEKLIQDHLWACDPSNPDSMYSRYLAPGRRKAEALDRDRWHSILIHYAPLDLIDPIDQICREHPLPTAAAEAIARRFMRADLCAADQAIFEEFERRKRQ